MKSSTMILLGLSFLPAQWSYGQARGGPQPVPPPPPAPPPVSTAPAHATRAETFVYEQKPIAGRPYLVTPEQAQAVIDRFKEAYPKMGSPRILIYVNRELIDESSGLKLSARSGQTETVRTQGDRELAGNTDTAVKKGSGPGGTERATNKNTYRIRERREPALADKQTVRDVERLFGRPLRMGGATLADQRVASQLISGKALDNLTVLTDSEQARKDREALLKVADMALEILISSRNVTLSEVSGDKVYAVPDIQATAIRLSDARILGQATAADLIGHDRYAARVVKSFGIRDIAEATALSLMEDMLR